jgi:hypothetical protein
MGGNKTPWVDTLGIVPGYHAHLMSGGRPRSGQVPGARRITVAEAAAIQSFPGWVRFTGSRSSQYRQVGNAVPPDLAQVVANALARSPFCLTILAEVLFGPDKRGPHSGKHRSGHKLCLMP